MKKYGYTLTELIVAIAIIAVVSSSAIVSFSLLGSRQLDADARRIVFDMGWARELSSAGHQNYIIDFDLINERYIIYRNSVGPGNEIKRQKLSVDLSSVAPLPAQIQFSYPKGTAQTKDIILNHQGKTKQISVFAQTGYAKIQ